MVVDVLAAPLLRVELFQGLNAQQLAKIARAAERIVFRAGEQITAAGQEAVGALLIVGGAAEWHDSGDAGSEEIEIGSLIGEMAMFVEHVYGATVVAKTQVRCLRLNRDGMRELLMKDQPLADHLTNKVAMRLHRVADQLRSIDAEVLNGALPLHTEMAAQAAAMTHH
jgi:signal-transduction protein with cAMP-binding, CBS, and nucleotidyltransferase domain